MGMLLSIYGKAPILLVTSHSKGVGSGSYRKHWCPSVTNYRPLKVFYYRKRCYPSVIRDRPLKVFSYRKRCYPSVIRDRPLKVISYRKHCYLSRAASRATRFFLVPGRPTCPLAAIAAKRPYLPRTCHWSVVTTAHLSPAYVLKATALGTAAKLSECGIKCIGECFTLSS